MTEEPKQSKLNEFMYGKEGEKHINQPELATPAAEAAPLDLEGQFKALGEWQAVIVKELKSINGKLGFFVVLALLGLAISFLGAILP